MKACIFILPIVLFGCGSESTDDSSNDTTAGETKPSTESKSETAPGGEPPEKADVGEETDAVTPRLVVDAEGQTIGTIADLEAMRLDVDLHQGFAPKNSAVCYFKAANCEGECYTLATETWSYMDGDTIFITTKENKRDVTISGAGVDRPWLSETGEKGCIESAPSKSEGREEYHAADRKDFTLPFHQE